MTQYEQKFRDILAEMLQLDQANSTLVYIAL